MLNNVVEIIDFYISHTVKAGDNVIDATCGNGYDTVFLSNMVGENGKVFAFDIQESAIIHTKKIIAEKSQYQNIILIHDSHENVLKYVKDEITLCVFNLGYLPGGNKKIITTGQSTVRAVENIFQILKQGGIICICAYLGHQGGVQEYEYVKNYLNGLDCDVYNIVEIKHLIRHDDAPRILMIEKK